MGDYQVGVLPVMDENETKAALVTTRSGSRWTFPKGRIEEGRCDREVAEEEAGLVGEVCPWYQEFEISFGNASRIRLYQMSVHKVLKYWPEGEERKRTIVSIQEAAELLGEKRSLHKLRGRHTKEQANSPTRRNHRSRASPCARTHPPA